IRQHARAVNQPLDRPKFRADVVDHLPQCLLVADVNLPVSDPGAGRLNALQGLQHLTIGGDPVIAFANILRRGTTVELGDQRPRAERPTYGGPAARNSWTIAQAASSRSFHSGSTSSALQWTSGRSCRAVLLSPDNPPLVGSAALARLQKPNEPSMRETVSR